MLTHKEEIELTLRWQQSNDQAALDRIIRRNQGLIVAIANEFRAAAESHREDLIQEGNLGLIRAATKYDGSTRLSTYSALWIRAFMHRYCMNMRSVVRMGTSRRQRIVIYGYKKARDRIERDGGTASMDEIAEALGVNARDVEITAPRLSGGDVSIDAPRHGYASFALISELADDRASAEDEMIRADARAEIEAAIGDLPLREQRVIRRRILTEKPETLKEIADDLGVCRERVRQIEARAIKRLKESLEVDK